MMLKRRFSHVLRHSIFQFHRWLALIAMVPLVLLGLSGAVLTFENELDRLLNPTLWSVEPRNEWLTWQAVVERVRERYPRDAVGALRIPAGDAIAAELSLGSGLLVYCDPHDGTIRGTRRRGESVTTKIHQFHTNLLVGEVGSKVMGASALALVVLSLSGLVLWWRVKVATFRLDSRKRFWFDAHSALGLYGLVFWLVLGTTGAMMTFEQFVEPALYQVTRSAKVELVPLSSSPADGRTPISVDAAIEAARQALPGTTVALISLPRQPRAAYVAFAKFPEDRTPAGRSRVQIDQYSGRILSTINTRELPVGPWIWAQHRSWHTGDWLGWPTRLLASLASVMVAIQVVSGFVLFWRGWRKASNSSTPIG